MKRLTAFAAATAMLGLAGPAVAQDNPMVGGAPMLDSRTIVENAVNSADHETLVAAVKQAGLAETLSGEGPFTVFAPTDAAFAKLPDGTVESLMQPAAKKKLAKILTCHVVAASAMSDAIGGMIADDGGMHPIPTVGGCTIEAREKNGEIILTDERGRKAAVTTADVRQSNGVIHVIDSVLLPGKGDGAMQTDAAMADDGAMSDDGMAEGAMSEDSAMPGDSMSDGAMSDDSAMAEESMSDGAMSDAAMASDNPKVGGAAMFADRTIVENAVNSKAHTTLVAAVKQAGLVETLSGEGPFTVFAPTDAAFAKLPDGTVESLMQDSNRDALKKVLTGHVVAGDITAAQLRRRARNSSTGFYNFTAVSGDALSAQARGNAVYIFDESGTAGRITIPDVKQSNGVIHVVDTVLVPK